MRKEILSMNKSPQKFLSKTINREFYVDKVCTDPIDGLPCFSFKEMEILKTRKIEPTELSLIFDAKVKLGATVDKILAHTIDTSTALVKPNSPEDLGYVKHTKASPAEFAKRIRETIENSKIKAKGFDAPGIVKEAETK